MTSRRIKYIISAPNASDAPSYKRRTSPMDSTQVDTTKGSNITARTRAAASIDSPDANSKILPIRFTTTVKPINPKITEGTPANISIKAKSISRMRAVTKKERKRAHPAPTGTANKTANKDTYRLPQIMGKIPNSGGFPKGFQFCENRKVNQSVASPTGNPS